MVLGPDWESKYNLLLSGRCPLGFPDEQTFHECLDELLALLMAKRLTGWVALRGSSTTFLSMHPEKGRDPNVDECIKEYKQDPSLPRQIAQLHYFDCKIMQNGGYEKAQKSFSEYQLYSMYSDFDFNIKSRELVAMLQKSGAKPSSKEVGNNYNQDDTMNAIPELWDFKSKWGEKLHRDISFVTIKDSNDRYNYSKHPFTFKL